MTRGQCPHVHTHLHICPVQRPWGLPCMALSPSAILVQIQGAKQPRACGPRPVLPTTLNVQGLRGHIMLSSNQGHQSHTGWGQASMCGIRDGHRGAVGQGGDMWEQRWVPWTGERGMCGSRGEDGMVTICWVVDAGEVLTVLKPAPTETSCTDTCPHLARPHGHADPRQHCPLHSVLQSSQTTRGGSWGMAAGWSWEGCCGP